MSQGRSAPHLVALEHTVELFRRAGAPLLGVVINQVELNRRRRYIYYYKGYYNRYYYQDEDGKNKPAAPEPISIQNQRLGKNRFTTHKISYIYMIIQPKRNLLDMHLSELWPS
jgi:hypothetical protein